jgi:hypothetical protein
VIKGLCQAESKKVVNFYSIKTGKPPNMLQINKRDIVVALQLARNTLVVEGCCGPGGMCVVIEDFIRKRTRESRSIVKVWQMTHFSSILSQQFAIIP